MLLRSNCNWLTRCYNWLTIPLTASRTRDGSALWALKQLQMTTQRGRWRILLYRNSFTHAINWVHYTSTWSQAKGPTIFQFRPPKSKELPNIPYTMDVTAKRDAPRSLGKGKYELLLSYLFVLIVSVFTGSSWYSFSIDITIPRLAWTIKSLQKVWISSCLPISRPPKTLLIKKPTRWRTVRTSSCKTWMRTFWTVSRNWVSNHDIYDDCSKSFPGFHFPYYFAWPNLILIPS